MTRLAGGEVHVWIARPLAVTEAALARCVSVLSVDERAHVMRFRFERQRLEATVSRALVRTTLARYIGGSPSDLRYGRGPYGRPHVDPPCGVDFNATNHPELVACAVSLDGTVGVDVEPISRGEQILEVAESVFSTPELDALDRLDRRARADRAVSLWTCKEALTKGLGLGLTAPLRQIVIDFPRARRPEVRFLSVVDGPADDAHRWWLETLDVTGFRIAVAVRATYDVKLVAREVDWSGTGSSAQPLATRLASEG